MPEAGFVFGEAARSVIVYEFSSYFQSSSGRPVLFIQAIRMIGAIVGKVAATAVPAANTI